MSILERFLRIINHLFGIFYIVNPEENKKADKEKPSTHVPVSTSANDEAKEKRVVHRPPTTSTGFPIIEGATYVSGTPSLESPLNDPRVMWIYEMNKEALKIQMVKYGPDIAGNTAKLLDYRFVDYWKKSLVTTALAAGLDVHSVRLPSPPTSSMVKISGGSDQAYLRRWQASNDDLTSIRKILGLSPNSDSESVKRTLTGATRVDQHYMSPVMLSTETYSNILPTASTYHGAGRTTMIPNINPTANI